LVGLDVLIADGLSPETAADWLAHRKRKRADLTARAWAAIKAEVAKAKWTLEAAITKSLARGWVGFESEWVAEAPNRPVEAGKASETAQYLSEQKKHAEKAVPPPAEVLAKLAELKGRLHS